MSLIKNQINAAGVGYSAYKQALNQISTQDQRFNSSNTQQERFSQYNLCWDAYQNSLYVKSKGYSGYLKRNELYAKTRQMYSYVEDIVDFYADRVYPGVINDQNILNSTQTGIPLLADDSQKAAIGQIFQWSNFATVAANYVTYGAAVGDSFLVVSDDKGSGRVSIQARKPWHLSSFERDDRGNVISSVEEFPVQDTDGKQYIYKREMNPYEIREFRDGDLTSSNPNDYGFVPIVYVQHRFNSSTPGKPAFHNQRALDEANSLGSRLNDYIMKTADTPMMLLGVGKVSGLAQSMGMENRGEEGGRFQQILIGETNGSKVDLSGNLDLGQAELRLTSLLEELKRANFETATYQRVRESGQTSGVAVRNMLGDVESRLSGAQGQYDAGLIISLRQALAIAGMRQSEGLEGWANKTDQQIKFSPYDLTSYHKGDLNFLIGPRPLITLEASDRLVIVQAEKALRELGGEG